MSNAVYQKFVSIMANEACDMAEVLFTTEREKRHFIENTWADYGDDIESFVEGATDDFEGETEENQKNIVRDAIEANFESIFDKSFDE